MTNLSGKEIGKYRITERIGLGGMAEVYKGVHTHLDRQVAIKVLHGYLQEGGDILERFKREAKAVANLRHPNIVQVYDFDIQDDIIFMVMEYIDGMDLQSRLVELDKKGGHLSIKQIGSIIKDVASALDYAHSQGMLHRDVKPSNILLDKNGKAYLTDFGIARLLSDKRLTAAGTLIGTPAYMSPEQGKGEEVTRESDIYSLGVVAFELITGQVPYDAQTPIAIVQKQIAEPVPELREFMKDAPENAQEVIEKALAKSPEKRFPSAEALVIALRGALEALEASDASLKVSAAPVSEETEAMYKPTVAMEDGAVQPEVKGKATVLMDEDDSGKPEASLDRQVAASPEVKAGKKPARKIPTWGILAGAVAVVAIVAVVLTQVLGSGPSGSGSGEDLFLQGEALYLAGDIDGAIEAFEQAIQAGYSDVNVYIELGSAKRDYGDYDGAIEHYGTAVEMDPENFNAWYGLAEAYYNTGEDAYKGEAHAAMDHALALEPDNPNAHWLMGVIRYEMFDNPDEAILDLTRAIDLSPNDSLFYNMRGLIYLQTGQWELCVSDYDRFAELDPENPWAYKERGDCYQGLGDLNSARQDYERFMQISEGNPELEQLRQDIQTWLDTN